MCVYVSPSSSVAGAPLGGVAGHTRLILRQPVPISIYTQHIPIYVCVCITLLLLVRRVARWAGDAALHTSKTTPTGTRTYIYIHTI